jgi:hypothetical protein
MAYASATTLQADAAVALLCANAAIAPDDSRVQQAHHWLSALRLGWHLPRGSSDAVPLAELVPRSHVEALGLVACVQQVVAQALDVAGRRGGSAATVVDVYVVVLAAYGRDFDAALEADGSSREEFARELIYGPDNRPVEVGAPRAAPGRRALRLLS